MSKKVSNPPPPRVKAANGVTSTRGVSAGTVSQKPAPPPPPPPKK